VEITKPKGEHLLAVNIPADGLFLAILNKANGDLSKDNCTRIIKKYIDRYLEANPDIILLNVCYRRSLTPSEVFDSYLYDVETDENGFAVKDENGQTRKNLSPTTQGVSKYFSSFFTCARILLQKGIDIYEILTKHIRQSGCKVFLSVRMNDGHYTDNPAINSYFAMKDGGRYTIDNDGFALDFSLSAVQNHMCEYIEELLNNYSIDGIELDWLRYTTHLPAQQRTQYSILNTYMQRIRKLLDSYNKNLSLAVRILPNEQDNLRNGVDAVQWVADGTADMITIENFYVPTNYEMPIAQWKESIEKRNISQNAYQLFCGSDWAVSCVSKYAIAMNPALVRGFATECLSNGADGIYLFNFFEENDTSSFELAVDANADAVLKNCFSERIKAAKDPYRLPRRYVHIASTNDRYPIALAAGEIYQFAYELKKPFNACEIVVGCDTDAALTVALTGQGAEIPLQNKAAFAGFAYVPENQIGKDNEFIYAVSQAAPYVKTAMLPTELLEKQSVTVTIQNKAMQPVKLLWIELSFV